MDIEKKDRYNRRALWLSEAKWGLIMHFISNVLADNNHDPVMTPEKWNKTVDGFNVDALAQQLHELGAGYFILTIGQISGYFCSPNTVYDTITAQKEISKCSRRDLVADLSEVLQKYGIRFLVYLPSECPDEVMLPFEYTLTDKAGFYLKWPEDYKKEHEKMSAALQDPRHMHFQRKWESVIREWSLRWGKKISGWWIDGSYFTETFYKHKEEPNFKSFARALRAGNPESIIAWNPGVIYPPTAMDEEEDYTAGEMNPGDSLEQAMCLGMHEKHEIFHVLAPFVSSRGAGPARRDPDRLLEETLNVTGFGGAVTWDIPFNNDGTIPHDIFAILKPFSQKINATRGKPIKPEIMQPRYRIKILDYPAISIEGHAISGKAELLLTNTRRTQLNGKITFESEGPLSIEPATAEYMLKPDQDQNIPLNLRLTEPSQESTKVIFPDGMKTIIPVRKQFSLPDNNIEIGPDGIKQTTASVNKFEFKAENGEIHGQLSIGLFSGKLGIWARIMDHNIKRCEKAYWKGSCIELFFAEDDASCAELPFDSTQRIKSPIRQFLAVPSFEDNDAAAFYLEHDFCRAENLICQSHSIPNGYELNCIIPAKELFKKEAVDSFLFEAIANIPLESGNIRVSLCGSKSACRDTSSYCKLIKTNEI